MGQGLEGEDAAKLASGLQAAEKARIFLVGLWASSATIPEAPTGCG
jgi:hypothetical protein